MRLGFRLIGLGVLGMSALFCAPFSVAHAADDVKNLGVFKDWSAYLYPDADSKVCFIAAKPEKSLPDGLRRGDVYAQVTHRTKEKTYGVFSVIAGYTFKPNSEAKLTIGNQSFLLVTQGDSAWARDEETDRSIAAAVRGGSKMTIEGVSSRGTKTTDTYSLSGSSAAMAAINKVCGAP